MYHRQTSTHALGVDPRVTYVRAGSWSESDIRACRRLVLQEVLQRELTASDCVYSQAASGWRAERIALRRLTDNAPL